MSGEPVFDDDNPEWTNEDFARAAPAAELPPHILAAFPRTRPDPRAAMEQASPIRRALMTQGAGARLDRLAA